MIRLQNKQASQLLWLEENDCAVLVNAHDSELCQVLVVHKHVETLSDLSLVQWILIEQSDGVGEVVVREELYKLNRGEAALDDLVCLPEIREVLLEQC